MVVTNAVATLPLAMASARLPGRAMPRRMPAALTRGPLCPGGPVSTLALDPLAPRSLAHLDNSTRHAARVDDVASRACCSQPVAAARWLPRGRPRTTRSGSP